MLNISVVIPTYNRPILLNRAIRSVLRQKSSNFAIEVVIIDDCSLEKVNLDEFKWDNIVYKKLLRNSGPQEARNQGILLATGDWIIMLDDDDEFFLNSIEEAFNLLTDNAEHTSYPVFFFSTSVGYIPEKFLLIGALQIMDETLKGDFTPIINRKLFLENNLRYIDYPEIIGVGCEHLTWLLISSKFKIPTFDFHIVKVNSDAPLRLTSYRNFIKNSLKFALQQDITIDFIKQHKIDHIHTPFLNKKYLGAAIYYLVSGKRYLCRMRLYIVRDFKPFATFVVKILSYMPIFISKFLLRIYKMQLTK